MRKDATEGRLEGTRCLIQKLSVTSVPGPTSKMGAIPSGL